MCGICGVVGRPTSAELGLMTDAMAHRGPDGRGVATFPGEPPAGLGHRRLAIIDPTRRARSRWRSTGRWWITYNGELYNFRELRAELEQRGERFESDCDTEVLLRLFVLDGPAMLERLNGIFAFAVWDDRDRRAVPRARPARRQAALLHAARRTLRVRLRARGAPAADRPADARRDRDRRLPHVPLGSRPEDGVPRDPQAAAGPLRLGRRDVVRGCTSTGTCASRPRTGPRASGATGSRTPSRARCAGRWSATSRSGLPQRRRRLVGDRRRDVRGREAARQHLHGRLRRGGPAPRDRPRRPRPRPPAWRRCSRPTTTSRSSSRRARAAAEGGLAPGGAGRRPGRDLDLPDLP